MWKSQLFGQLDLTYPTTKYLSYVTPHSVAKSIAGQMQKYYTGLPNKVLWDMFAGIGSDSIVFSTHFKKIIATEVNSETYKCGLLNTAPYNNIEFLHQDCTDGEQNPDLVYFDPPWGVNYRPNVPFSFEKETLANGTYILDTLKNITSSEIIIKSPLLCDSFETLFPAEQILNVFIFADKKIKFIFIKKNRSSDQDET
jgi:hypothetical protein